MSIFHQKTILRVEENLKRLNNSQYSLKAAQQKILVVDDEANIREILATRLKIVGYDVAIARACYALLGFARVGVWKELHTQRT